MQRSFNGIRTVDGRSRAARLTIARNLLMKCPYEPQPAAVLFARCNIGDSAANDEFVDFQLSFLCHYHLRQQWNTRTRRPQPTRPTGIASASPTPVSMPSPRLLSFSLLLFIPFAHGSSWSGRRTVATARTARERTRRHTVPRSTSSVILLVRTPYLRTPRCPRRCR